MTGRIDKLACIVDCLCGIRHTSLDAAVELTPSHCAVLGAPVVPEKLMKSSFSAEISSPAGAAANDDFTVSRRLPARMKR